MKEETYYELLNRKAKEYDWSNEELGAIWDIISKVQIDMKDSILKELKIKIKNK